MPVSEESSRTDPPEDSRRCAARKRARGPQALRPDRALAGLLQRILARLSAGAVMSSHPRILAVDDQRLVRLNLRFILRREGFDVDTAGDAIEALELLERNLYDLLITDIHLPGASGFEVLSHAKEVNPRIEVIVVTGSEGAQVREALLRARPAAVLRKPFSLADLTGVIRGLKAGASRKDPSDKSRD